MKSCFLLIKENSVLMQVHISLNCALFILISSIAMAQTTYVTAPHSPGSIRHSTLGTWTNFTTNALIADDNNYIEYKFSPSWAGSDRLICSNFDFSEIPDNATIDKLFLKIIRLKKGKSDVVDQAVYFSKHGGDQVMGPNIRKSGYWPALETAVIYSEDGTSAGSTDPNEPTIYGPYTYTSADVKNKDFNVYFLAYRYGNNNNFYIAFEQIQVWIQYTVPAAVTGVQQKANPQDQQLTIKQYNRHVFFEGLEQGQYKLSVTDLNGRVLQQSVIYNSGEQSVPLNDRCKGYCIITLEKNGKRKTLKTFVQ
jgi:hypothetical protein